MALVLKQQHNAYLHKWTAAYSGDLDHLEHAQADFHSETDRREEAQVTCIAYTQRGESGQNIL